MKLRLAKMKGKPEIFYTIQGEGVRMGEPAVFIRLSGCNLHCKWCDTPYTWNFDGTPFQHNGGRKFSVEEQTCFLGTMETRERIIDAQMQSLLDEIPLVITGGEPLLQQDALEALLMSKAYSFVEIETNGTIVPTEGLNKYVDQYNVSPKLSGSGNGDIAINAKAITWHAKNKKSYFKFVVSTDEDIDEIVDIIKRYEIDKKRVILMPEGITNKDIREKTQWLIAICKYYGFRFSTRLHVLAYGGAKRGV